MFILCRRSVTAYLCGAIRNLVFAFTGFFATPSCLHPRQASSRPDIRIPNFEIKHRYMKNDTMGLLKPINKQQMKDLTKETKETIAANVLKQPQNHRTFSSVDLWNTRRNFRSMTSMRRFN